MYKQYNYLMHILECLNQKVKCTNHFSIEKLFEVKRWNINDDTVNNCTFSKTYFLSIYKNFRQIWFCILKALD